MSSKLFDRYLTCQIRINNHSSTHTEKKMLITIKYIKNTCIQYLESSKCFVHYMALEKKCRCICCQVDLGFRKTWDKLIIKLDVVDKDEDTSCEVVHWVMHFPVSKSAIMCRFKAMQREHNFTTIS